MEDKVSWNKVLPVMQPNVRILCAQKYPGHPYGCPNFNKRAACPPRAKLLYKILDFNKQIWVVWNVFDLASHVNRMRLKHPDWSWRRLVCCLYWQQGARKKLSEECIKLQHNVKNRLITVACPEACGVNITETMKQINIHLEWPPKTVTYQVALMGSKV